MDYANDNQDGKVCTKCGEWKALALFYNKKRRSGKMAKTARCKQCIDETNRAWRLENRELDLALKRTYAAAKSAEVVERVRLWRLKPGNRERKNTLEQARRKAQSPEQKRRSMDMENARRRRQLANDPIAKMLKRMRQMLERTYRAIGTPKQKKTRELLGFSPEQLQLRMECQFKPGMSWDNHGQWHIDHKKPIAAFVRQGILDPRQINMLSNLQPLWAPENYSKSAAWPLIAANDNQKRDKDAA
jgi:hypothetical protein